MDKSKIVVLLSAGHTKSTPGKRSPDGRFLEWSFNRKIVTRLKAMLTKAGIAFYDVHPEDDFILGYANDSKDLVLRVKRANERYAQLKTKGLQAIYISVHANAAGTNCGWTNATGFSVYVSTNASEKSRRAARMFQLRAEAMGLRGNRSVPLAKYHEANFYVLRNTHMPAVLTENLFYTNKAEVDFLLSEQGQEVIAKLHFDTIIEYINSL